MDSPVKVSFDGPRLPGKGRDGYFSAQHFRRFSQFHLLNIYPVTLLTILDGDLYESILANLEYVYPRLPKAAISLIGD
jgi:hypothetical protein